MAAALTLPRLVAVDLDGTLLPARCEISERTRETLDRVRATGCAVLFVTARHPVAVTEIARTLGLDGEAVCCVGAVGCRVPSGRITWTRAIPARIAAAIAQEIPARLPGVELGWVHADRVGYQPGYSGPLLMGSHYYGNPSGIRRPVLKMFGVGRSLDDDVVPVLRGVLADRADIGHHFPGVVDLVAPGVSKVTALRRYCRTRGITSAQVVSFGDSAADLPMIRWAGHGVVMGNAPRSLHAMADEVAPSCDEDGVAHVLDRLFART